MEEGEAMGFNTHSLALQAEVIYSFTEVRVPLPGDRGLTACPLLSRTHRPEVVPYTQSVRRYIMYTLTPPAV